MRKQTVGAEIQVYLYLILLPLDIYSNITPPFVSSLEREKLLNNKKSYLNLNKKILELIITFYSISSQFSTSDWLITWK